MRLGAGDMLLDNRRRRGSFVKLKPGLMEGDGFESTRRIVC